MGTLKKSLEQAADIGQNQAEIVAEFYENKLKRGRNLSRRLGDENARIAMHVLSCEPETTETTYGENQMRRGLVPKTRKPLAE